VELRREEPGVLVVVVLGASVDSHLRREGQQGDQDRRSHEVAAQVGLASGKILNRSTLEDTRQFSSSSISRAAATTCASTPRWKISPATWSTCTWTSPRAKRARIRQINVVGNERFTDEELLAGTELKPHNLLSFYKQDDRYSRESLEGDLEKLRSYYMDRGLRGFRDHLHAGGAGAGEGRPLHHRERI
jgi:outer membrane protein insertion porin family